MADEKPEDTQTTENKSNEQDTKQTSSAAQSVETGEKPVVGDEPKKHQPEAGSKPAVTNTETTQKEQQSTHAKNEAADKQRNDALMQKPGPNMPSSTGAKEMALVFERLHKIAVKRKDIRESIEPSLKENPGDLNKAASDYIKKNGAGPAKRLIAAVDDVYNEDFDQTPEGQKIRGFAQALQQQMNKSSKEESQQQQKQTPEKSEKITPESIQKMFQVFIDANPNNIVAAAQNFVDEKGLEAAKDVLDLVDTVIVGDVAKTPAAEAVEKFADSLKNVVMNADNTKQVVENQEKKEEQQDKVVEQQDENVEKQDTTVGAQQKM